MEEVIAKILEKKGLTLSYEICFPDFDELPKEIELALAVLKSRGMKIRIVLQPKNNKPQ